MLEPQLVKRVLSSMGDRPSILDAVRLGMKSKKELETWALFCACLSWGGLFGKRKLLISFYNNLQESFLDFIENPSQDKLRFIYKSENGSLLLLGLCFSIRDLLKEYGSISNLVRESESVKQAIFRLAHTLRENLEEYPPQKRFNLPKVNITPPTTVKDKIKTNAMKRYCMYFRWMVRDSEPDFGIWKFFDKRDLFHPLKSTLDNVFLYLSSVICSFICLVTQRLLLGLRVGHQIGLFLLLVLSLQLVFDTHKGLNRRLIFSSTGILRIAPN